MATNPSALGPKEASKLTTGERIEVLLMRRRVKPRELAVKIGVNPSTLWRYRREGADIPHDKLMLMAINLNTTTDYLVGLSEVMEPVRDGDTRVYTQRPSRTSRAHRPYIKRERTPAIVLA